MPKLVNQRSQVEQMIKSGWSIIVKARSSQDPRSAWPYESRVDRLLETWLKINDLMITKEMERDLR